MYVSWIHTWFDNPSIIQSRLAIQIQLSIKLAPLIAFKSFPALFKIAIIIIKIIIIMIIIIIITIIIIIMSFN